MLTTAPKFSSAFVVLKQGIHLATFKVRERNLTSLVVLTLPTGENVKETSASSTEPERTSKTMARAARRLMNSELELSSDLVTALILASNNPETAIEALRNHEHMVIEI
ncbi:hypothetical protein [Pseudovibrio brasiliensis]|uniref:Uncharacterized protein n=1 Tax=Pseudovibrio brasiliensis TaxID=1898042 RepID=A0ABX8AX32_9HYPH|nr:hypothetical protein [Pseudovibrio brasiliensis]QUS59128.1 hypothetical protein KGB56_26785 [Pseudovibrio brasiliensis]